MSQQTFTWGITGLDELIGKALVPGTSILIAGNPGTGKTTLAATVCYNNALRGHPCLYVSFQEDKERFYSQMKIFNLDFEKLEKEKKFWYLRLPVFSEKSVVTSLFEQINKAILEHKVKVIVIDSFTPLGIIYEKNIEVREILQNFFYNISKTTSGLVILISEIPYGKETVEQGGIEFVTDIVILLKHRLESGLLVRTIEIRKARRAALTLAEIPFAIIEGIGIRVYVPPMIEEIPSSRDSVEFCLPCKILKEAIGTIYSGQVIYGPVYPPDARIRLILKIILAATILANKLKTLVISYYNSPEEFFQSLRDAFIEAGIDTKYIDELKKYIDVISLNPAIMSLEELYSREVETVFTYKPKLLIFDRVDIASTAHGTVNPARYFKYLYNQALIFRRLGIIVNKVSIYEENSYRINAGLANVVIRVLYEIVDGKVVPYVYIWREGKIPRILSLDDIQKCISELKENVFK